MIILHTALRLFAKKGYDSVSTQEIVDEAGLSKPTLYYYFHNKQGLMETIISQYGAVLLELFRRDAEYHRDLTANLTGIFQNTLRFALEHGDFFRFILALFPAAPETQGFQAGNGLRRQLVAILEQLFAEASFDHGNMKHRQRVYAETFMGLLETWALLLINGEIKVSSELQYRIVHQYMHGVFS